MFEHYQKEEILRLIQEIETVPAPTQRRLSAKIGISLGKTNYLLKELIKKGIITAKNFSAKEHKAKRIAYMLTKRGIEEKSRLTYHFLKRKELEYNQIKKEWEKIEANNNYILKN